MKKSQQQNNLQQVSDDETQIILDEARKVLRNDCIGDCVEGCVGDIVESCVGDIVEFGCYKGDTSLLLERMLEREFPSSSVKLWLYDSFEGLPERSREDISVAGDAFSAGELLATKREVVEKFKKAGLRVPRIRKGFFEELEMMEKNYSRNVIGVLPEKISFAFLDGDLYQSIKTSLRLVAPRIMNGTIVVHDYNNPQLPGVAKAVDEWIAQQKTAPRLQRRKSLAIISWT